MPEGLAGSPRDQDRVVVELDWVEAMGTLAALRAVIDSTPGTVRPEKLISAERKIVEASHAS